MKRIIYIAMLLICLFDLKAQVGQSPESVIEDLLESLSGNDIDLNNQSQIFDDLLELAENPLDLNASTKSELEKLIFLSDIQIRNILDFVKRMKPLYSKYQLQGVGGLARKDIERMMMFVSLDPIKVKSVYRKRLYGQMILRDQFDVEKAKAYNNSSGTEGYRGDRHHLYTKLQMQYGRNIHVGTVMDKDPGEEIIPVDFLSAYVMYQGDNVLKTLIVGDYHANFGQGLALWTGTSMGKTTESMAIRKRGEGFRKYSSANEYAFFRGVATTLTLRDFELSLFISQKDRDAGISSDSIFSVVESMSETGYHRTSNEIDRRKKLGQSTLGANLDYRFKNLSLSVGAYRQKYDSDSVVVKQLYQYSAHEKVENSLFWFGYNYGFNKLLVFGEYALDDNNSAALVNGLQFKPANNVSVALLHRYFSNEYFSSWTNSFSENSFPAGESGFYVGMNIFPIPKVKLTGYVDVFKTKWLKYSVDKPSHGYDISFQANYDVNESFKVYLRYREKEKFKNQTLAGDPAFLVVNTHIKKIRLHADIETSANLALQMRIEKSFYKEENLDDTEGLLAYSGIKYTTSKSKLSCWLRYVIFDTEDYDSRLYAYENDLLYNFYTPSFQGEGSRAYIMVRYQIVDNIKVWMKVGRTSYSDRDKIGSGLQAIDSNSRTNIRMQLQIKF